jgi:cellulose synthase/poly-beta-1,6-N-acetylglucosamine synthase-like glycosyltransferase
VSGTGVASSLALWTAATGVVWTIAGALLLLWGWLTLPLRRPGRSTPRGSTRFPRLVRVLAGALIAGGAAVLGALVAGQGGAAATIAGAQLSAGAYSFLVREAAGFAAIFSGSSGVPGFLATAFGRVGLGFLRIGRWTATGATVLAHGLSFGAGFESQYVLANQAAVAAAIATGGLVGWVSASSRWRYSGVATYIGLDLMALGFLACSLAVVETTSDPVAAAFGLWLAGAVLFGFFLMLIYQFYALEHLAGEPEPSGPQEDLGVTGLPDPWPFVLLQVASYNEPVEVVRECLRSVCAIDYPRDRFAVQLCDDSTDPASLDGLAAFCAGLGVDFRHRSDRRGFKGGALNDGLAAFPGAVDFVAIVDSDYVVRPGFLRRVIPEFRHDRLGFVQTPQAYRNVRPGALSRWYELADSYFYRVVQPVRARFQSLIFCGTMGVLRRAALEEAGGWSEQCVTEDAELTIRLLALHWEGRYIPEEFGAGLAPDLMSAVRSQQRRWAFGGIQMLRLNRKLLASNQLNLRQRLDFLTTALFWFDGLFLVGVTVALAALVVASWTGAWLPFDALPVPAIIALVPALLMIDGLVKIRAALRRTRDVSFRDVLGVLTFWYAIKLNDLRAAVRAWFGRPMAFVRTPKHTVDDPGRTAALVAAIRSSRAETIIAVGLAGIVIASPWVWMATGAAVPLAYGVFLVWLVYYAYAFASALWFDYRSRRNPPVTVPDGAVGMGRPKSVEATSP